MSLDRLSWKVFLIFTLGGILFSPFPFAFAVFFSILLVYQQPLDRALVYSGLIGLLLDGLDALPILGIHAISFFILTRVLFAIKKFFFADEWSTIFILTLLGALLQHTASVVQVAFFVNIPVKALLFRGCFHALIDACVIFFMVGVPARLLGKKPMKGKEYFLR